MAITGLHVVVYSADVEADHAFFRDVLGLAFVDAGSGRLFFASPPAEFGFHDGANSRHEAYLQCDEVEAEATRLRARGVACTPITDRGWGLVTTIRLPGGGSLGLYQPRHPTAHGTAGAASA